ASWRGKSFEPYNVSTKPQAVNRPAYRNRSFEAKRRGGRVGRARWLLNIESISMPKRDGPTIEVISHGPSCLDGVMAAAAVRRFYQGLRVHMRLAANGESDRVIQELKPRAGGRCDELWITDLSWNSLETADHLNALTR